MTRYHGFLELFKGQTGVYFATNGLTATAFAFIMPIMSLFLVKGLDTEPMYLGLYTVVNSFATILVSQWVTGLGDKGVAPKKLFLGTLLGIIAAAIGFSLATEFWHAVIVGLLIVPIASTSIPVILSMIRRYADQTGQDSTSLNAKLRSSVSLLWIVGPPLAFLTVDNFGFKTNFLMAGLIAAFVFILVFLFLKDVEPAKKTAQNQLTTSGSQTLWLLFATIVLANIANSTYLNAMPLYLTQELAFPTSYPGYLLGLTAAIEIPAMLLAAKFAKRWNSYPVLMFGLASALVFYVGMYFATSYYALMVIQIFNGIFFGIFVGLAVSMMQDLAQGAVGKVTALYSNAMMVGTMIGSSTMGLTAQFFGYKAPFISCFLMMSMSLFLLVNVYRRTQPTSAIAVQEG